ncbi:pancreatic lipase-related protein 2-like [Pseudophryne corroboree]|uniref:pancreatic lipase-related protein 2-like n=1 Tax=Pseudophryne corroboree TaxID=495146 RepID=UPI003081BB5B
MLHCRDGIGLVMSSARFPPNMMSGIEDKKFNLCLIRLENLVTHDLRVLQVHFGKLQGAGFPCSNGSCAMMGYYADLYVRDSNTSQKFYLNTGYPKNFSRWRYRVSVTIAGTTFAMGSFTISLCGSNGCSCQHKIHSGLIHSGISYTAFIDVEKDIYPVKKVTFVWHKHMVSFFHPTLTASFVSIQYGPNGRIYTFCGSNPIKEDIRQTLKAC